MKSDHQESQSDNEQSSQSYEENNLMKLRPEIVDKKPRSDKKANKPHQKQSANSQAVKKEQASIPRTISFVKETKPRLIINHMILQNFKSYAGRQVVGNFHKNFTSVVGPNGSGKSNLIESMLFIFGYNASWMRLNKLNQLIHKSSTMIDVPKAAVEVHFKKIIDNLDGSVSEVAGSQFFIRRSVNTSSVSKYFLDGKDSTQGEVKERLKAEGIDLNNNRFLILQGEVEQISQMKQKSGDRDKPGLLEYLEDIIGSNQFIEKIEECLVEYNQAEEQKHEKGQLMRVVENQLKGMSKSKDDAIRYIKREKRIFQLQNILHQVTLSEAQAALERQRQQLKRIEEIKDRIMGQERERMKKQTQRIREIKKNKTQIEQIQKQMDKNQQKIQLHAKKDKNLTHQVGFKSEDLVKYQRKLEQSNRNLSKIISESEQIKKQIPVKSQKIKIKAQELQQMKKQLSKYDKPELRQKIKEQQSEIKKMELEKKAFVDKLSHLRQVHEKQKSNTTNHEGKIKEYFTKVNQDKDTQKKIEYAQSVAAGITKTKKAQILKMKQSRQQIRRKIQNLDMDIRENQNESNQQGQRSNMFKQIMKQKIPGVLGRLGDLGATTKQYDEVITTCCSKLDNIVVQTYEAATSVVEFLKRTKIGRATCIILDKINQYKSYMARNFNPLNKAVRLFDVVKTTSDEARLAFYFALNDTLYVQNTDLGLQYSMKNDQQRRRVISRKRGGFIIYEMNGLMIGSVARRGGFETKATVKGKNNQFNTKEIEADKKKLQQKYNQINSRVMEEQQQLKKTEADIDQMGREMYTVRQNIRQLSQEIKDLREMMDKQKNRPNSTDSMEREIKSISVRIEQLDKNKMEPQKYLKQLEKQQRLNQSEAVAKLREKFKVQKGQYSKMEKQFEKGKIILQNTQKRVNQNKKQRQISERTKEMLKRDINKLKDEQLNLQKEVTQILGKMAGYEQKLKQTKKKDQQLKVIMEDDEKQVNESRNKVEKAKKDIQTCKQKCRNQQQDRKFAQSQLDRVRQRYKDLTSDYDFMQDLQEIDQMTIGNEPKVISDLHSSFLETSMMNSSMDSSMIQAKNFPNELVTKIEPTQDMKQHQVQSFIYFKVKLNAMTVSESNTLKKMEGSNIGVINEFRHKYISFKERMSEFEAVKQRQQELKKLIDKMKQQRLSMFREGFGIINSKLKEVYQHLTRGGDAELELIDSLDPFSDGVNFSVRPPKKSWKEVNKLSGGQKTLSSLSLIFALHYYKPTPLYFMDQIDAALDFKNVSIVADYIKKRTKDAQFIIISLRNNMFDLANKLIGVYKTYDKTKVVTLQPSKLIASYEQHRQKQNININVNTQMH